MPQPFNVTYLLSPRMSQIADAYIRLGGDLRPALRSVAVHMKEVIEDRFRTETDPEGNRWAEISAAWKARKKKLGRQTQILRFRDKLFHNVRGTGIEYDKESVTQGANIKYARIHQLGGRAGRGHRTKIVPRPFLGWSEKDRQYAEREIHDHISKATK